MNYSKYQYNLRDRITFQTLADPVGGVVDLDEYQDYKSTWTEARFLRGRNFYTARASNVKTDVEFIIRYREDLSESMRVAYKGRNYEIEGIIPMDSHKGFMTLNCYEIKPDM